MTHPGLQSPSIRVTSLGKIQEVVAMDCNYYRRKDTSKERYVVYLDWPDPTSPGRKTKRWSRTRFDDKWTIRAEFMAQRLCHQINGDIERDRKAFDPRRWFSINLSYMRFQNYGYAWIEARLKGRDKPIKAVTARMYEQTIQEASVTLGKFDIREMRKAHLNLYLDSLPDNLAIPTLRNKLRILRSLFGYALDNEDIDKMPRFPKLSAQESETRWLDEADQERVLEHIPHPEYPLFRFMLYYGLRVSECCAFMWDCVLWNQNRIVIKRTVSGSEIREARKAGDILYLPLTNEIKELLKPLRGFHGYVFRNRAGNRFDRRGLLERCYVACDKAGLARCSLHQLSRHSKGGQLINRGATLEQIGALLGHKSIQTTKRYAKLRVEGIRSLVE